MRGLLKVLMKLTILLLISGIIQAPKAFSADVTIQEKALVFVTDVIGLDITIYDQIKTRTIKFSNEPTASWQETVIYTFESSGNKIEIFCDFRANTIVSCHISKYNGTLFFVHPTAGYFDAARSFIDKYQEFTQASHLGLMKGSLDSVEDLKPITTMYGNIKLLIENKIETEGYLSLNWMNTADGIENSYNVVSLRFRDGIFEWFTDNWNRYPIGSSDVSILKDEAIGIVKERLQTFTYQFANETVSNLTVADKPEYTFAQLSMQPRADSKLYPLWEIHLPLNKVYPGLTTEVVAALWADTGEVISLRASGSLGGPSISDLTDSPANDGTQHQLWHTILIIGVILIIGATVIIRLKRRKSH
jgi:hypothetical protein